ncbi:J domain-containing protein [Exilibacterium tricleocarpae]|uniref:J domain-containing protein n=1 Tax=Exilibacterium tricleocarpae TaxID=2591008 RepID=A0A545U6S2_9GAMM|nr:DnaJ C-terminal domain-containing protein [Exilibacterium tricleocarpae]TQV85157.1 J domain-containing protein [Exilibacterium tricleocarpae]
MEYKDYYKVLGLDRSASQADIKRSYRKLARKYHPDVSKEADADERFKELGEAYEVLRDPEKRGAYDQLGANWDSGQDFRPPPDWAEGFEFHGGGFTGADTAGFSDFFESLFGGGFGAGPRHSGGGQFSRRGEDTYSRVSIDLEDAYRGCTRTITLRHSELGPDGRPLLRDRTLNVTIPKGIRQGQQIRLAGQGGAGLGQGAAGDLYLEVQYRPHSLYRAEGRDVYLDLPVAPWEAALGASIKVPTPGGTVDLKIPSGSGSGGKLRLKGRGIPGSPPGDLYAVIQVTVPRADSATAQALYREMQEKLDYNPRAKLGV